MFKQLGKTSALFTIGLAFFLFIHPCRSGAEQRDLINKSEDEAIKWLGPPSSELELGNEKTLVYPDKKVYLTDGVIKKVVATKASDAASDESAAKESGSSAGAPSATQCPVSGSCNASDSSASPELRQKCQEWESANQKYIESAKKLDQEYKERFKALNRSSSNYSAECQKLAAERAKAVQALREDLGLTSLAKEIQKLQDKSHAELAEKNSTSDSASADREKTSLQNSKDMFRSSESSKSMNSGSQSAADLINKTKQDLNSH